ncbi:MAG: hypothetical protein AAFV90_09445 [Cyanobacteria bacterium J06634_5]
MVGTFDTDNSDLSACYHQLQIRTGATAEDVDTAYFRLRAQEIREGNRQNLALLKQARERIKAHLSEQINEQSVEQAVRQPRAIASSTSEPPHRTQPAGDYFTGTALLISAFAERDLTAKVSVKEQILNIGIGHTQQLSPSQITARSQQVLGEVDQAACELQGITTVRLFGLDDSNKAQWKKSFPLPQPQLTEDDVDLYSYNNRFSNTLIFPGLLLIGGLLSSAEVFKALLFGVHIWIHEFGHATVAWLGGYRATPLPFGWTAVGQSQSLFVYFGVLTLLGLLFYTGRKEQSRWSIGLAVGLAVVQFCMTWLLSEETFNMLLSFGGIGGEFYLSTLLIVSFYFPLPDYWRWDFFRYPAALFASFVLTSSAWQWRQIDRGLEAIPWGSLFGGSEHIGGDMNQLSIVYGWSDQRIIDTYNSIGAVCAIAILSTYFYSFIKQRNYVFLHQLWQRTQK